jgi:dTDP-4-dehydrorhamnose reductase
MSKILILGASGMLGSATLRVFTEKAGHEVIGSIRSHSSRTLFPAELQKHLVVAGDVENHDALTELFLTIRPQVVINCIGLIKQLSQANDPLNAIPINALLPHRIARLCALVGARMVHISTDCVFSGSRGAYLESDVSDAQDLYGRSKYLGEVDYPHAVTLRTSIIGRELSGANGLIGWFLKQEKTCMGYSKAVFSGLPTVELARVIRDIVLPRPELRGLYHVASSAINKYDLLELVAKIYKKNTEVTPDSQLVIDRSLNADRFAAATGYIAPTWPELIATMHLYEETTHV